MEAVAAAAIVTVCAGAMLAGAAPGTAFAFYVVSYGAVRFGLEFARGDAGRGAFAGMTQPQWLSLACAIALLALGASGTAPVGPLHVVLTAALVAVALSLLVRAGRTLFVDTRREPSCHS